MQQQDGVAAADPRQVTGIAIGPLKLSPIPDFASRGRLLSTAFAVWIIAVVALVATRARLLALNLGDTDDALRLTMVRDLVAGRGWYDQKLTRLQPPLGLYMHWSRLIDGGEALVTKLFGLVLEPAQAEFAMRLTWPLLWILPLIVGLLMIARRLGGGRAVFMGAMMAVLSFRASGEFLPGRIDHHNVQVTCCMVALAAAVQAPTAGWAALCGLATALGLAVGLESIVFLALIGAAIGLSWAFARAPARSLIAYGAALAVGTVAFHLIQTPPQRWALSACDALGLNLVAGVVTAGAGVVAAAVVAAKAAYRTRLTLLAGVGALASGVYLGLDPLCVHGPIAGVDPVLKAVWLDQIREMQPWTRLLAAEPSAALSLAAPVWIGLLSLAWLAWRQRRRPSFALLVVSPALLVATVLALMATRSAQYAIWFSAPLAGAALADFAGVCLGGLMLPTVALAATASFAPLALAGLVTSGSADAARAPQLIQANRDDCISAAALAPLSRLPRGLVLSEIDEGPYILANTPHAVVQAPYHRMGWGIRQARAALIGPAESSRPLLRQLGVTYVADCPGHSGHADRANLRPDALQNRLDLGRPPAWLQPLSARTEPLQIYVLH
jgi:hypothetical protein